MEHTDPSQRGGRSHRSEFQNAVGSERRPGLDWLRAAAAVCVVLLHGGIPYCTHPLPGLVWSTWDSRPSSSVDALTWNINVWVMPLFFILSGFLAGGLLERCGPVAFFRHRLVRLGGPLVFGACVILPLDLYAWMLSWVGQGWIEPVKLRSLKVQSPLGEGMWGLSHLWYLSYLLIYCGVAALIAHTSVRPPKFLCFAWNRPPLLRSGRFLRRTERSESLLTFALLTLAVIMLYLQPRILVGFRHSFLPLWENLIFFGIWFTLGWRLGRRQVVVTRSHVLVKLGLGTIGFLGLLPLIHAHVQSEAIPCRSWLLPAMYVGVGWLIASGLFEGALLWRRRPPAFVGYVAEASFWIYLVHHPVIGLAQGNLAQSDWPAEMKFAATTSLTLAFSLLTYHAWVRDTLLGTLINGPRRPRAINASEDRSRKLLEPGVLLREKRAA